MRPCSPLDPSPPAPLQGLCAVSDVRHRGEGGALPGGMQRVHADQGEGARQAAPAQRRGLPHHALQGAGRQRLLVLLHLRRQQQHQGGARDGQARCVVESGFGGFLESVVLCECVCGGNDVQGCGGIGGLRPEPLAR